MKAALAVVGLLAAVALIVVVREATMSRHVAADPSSRMDVVVAVRSDLDDVDLAEHAAALFLTCQLEVDTDPVGPPQPVGDATFRFRIQPALDETDQRQLHGCLEDARIDHLQGSVVAMRRVAPGSSAARSTAAPAGR